LVVWFGLVWFGWSVGRLAERLLASQEELCSIQSVSQPFS